MTRLRLALAAVGLILAVVGVVRDDRRVTGAAIVVLLLSAAIRLFFARRDRSSGSPS